MNTYRGFDNRQADWRKLVKDVRAFRSCGIQSLHHARLLLGQPSDLGELFRAGDILDHVWNGHDGGLVKTVARRVGVKVDDFTTDRLPELRRNLNRRLKRGLPVVLGSNQEGIEHWLVVAGFDDDGQYILVDSADDPITGVWDWEDMQEWLGDDDAPYEALAVLPWKPALIKRSMVPHIAGIWQTLGEDSELAGRWGALYADLQRVFDYPPERGAKLDSETFFECNRNPILQPLFWEHPEIEATLAENLYADYRTVANFHNFCLPARSEAHATTHMAMILRNELA